MPDEKTRHTISLNAVREMGRNSFRVLSIIWKERRMLVLAILFIFLILSVSPFLISGSRGYLINELVKSVGSPIPQSLFFAITIFIGAGALIAVFRSFESYAGKIFWFFLEAKFELLLTRKKGEIDVAAHEDPKHNDLFNRVKENGVWRIQNFADRQFFLLQNLLEALIASSILLVAEWWVFFVIFVSTLPELVTEAKYGHTVWNIHTARSETRRKFWNLRRHFDWVSSLIELKLFQNIDYFISMIGDLFRTFYIEEQKNERRRLTRELISLIFSQAGMAFAAIWFIFKVTRGEIQIGTLTFFLASIGDLRQALSGLFQNLGRQYQDSLFVSDVFKILDLKPVLSRAETPLLLTPETTPEITFENVSFTYPGTKTPVLKNFSIIIPAGEKLAIVGANGAGKTTLVKLICRFYDPDEGKILIDGKDLKLIDLENWYAKLGVLFQDFENYQFAVKDAIGLGRSHTEQTLPKIKSAAHASEANTFIEEWEHTYEQILGKQFTGGVEPSIGQWQKLALARTFYRDPRIYILDEPTSAIDAESEAKIFEKLESLPKDRSVILISHRFSTVRQATRICVIEHGALAEIGTHEQLLAQNGIYARLFTLQAKGYR